MYATAASRSNTTGRSQNTASCSVIAKSWIIVGPGTGTSVEGSSRPSGDATWYVRYGGTKPYPKKCNSPVAGSSFGCAVMEVSRRPEKSYAPTVDRSEVCSSNGRPTSPEVSRVDPSLMHDTLLWV